MLNKRTIEQAQKYCKDDIKEIEGYNKAITSDKRYCCHHKNGINVSQKELIEKGLYYNRPASELIFLSISEHIRLHNKGKHYTEETKKKMSNSLKGKFIGEKNGMYGKGYLIAGENHPMAKQCTINGTTYRCIKDAHKALYPNMAPSTFYRKYRENKL